MKNTLKLEDIPVSYRDIADTVGVDSFIKLCKRFGGTNMYVPTPRSVFKPIRDANIKKEFNGSNYRELSLKYGICETQIRKILSK
ncbi:Mor transcription activator family protein [Tepidibacter thalassicus]|uniref:Mor transcription activator family protein n=1 Tax=Tepidibacter thalassicus DSM 15285 TaxID=1123350 RepID=A0A1M5SU06_9FIRM|nr:Mor transcription activator family protein [Tepidibacter thalassicus]SHH41947.1 Mor transcription activator family protein [Tepidibacter thalassicus DSM 15285]